MRPNRRVNAVAGNTWFVSVFNLFTSLLHLLGSLGGDDA